MHDQFFDTLDQVKRRFPDLKYRDGFDDAIRVFVKTSDVDQLQCEADGLDALREAGTVRVAQVIAVGFDDRYVLVIEAIESRQPSGNFFETFGHQLAELHRTSTAEAFGFKTDNYLGDTPQPNPCTKNWIEFWSQSRLGFQLKLARDNGYGGQLLQRYGDQLIQRLGSHLNSVDSTPSLIHGDLWSGNWICDEHNQPALIDPAVYFSNREAEFGMTTLFGGLPESFYGAYTETWPMSPGWKNRVEIYRLYHVLNHLNLFGESYLQQAISIMKRFV